MYEITAVIRTMRIGRRWTLKTPGRFHRLGRTIDLAPQDGSAARLAGPPFAAVLENDQEEDDRVDHDHERSRAGCHHPVLLAEVLRRHDQRMQAHVLGKPVGEPESSDSDHDEYGGFDIAPVHPKTLPLDARALAATGGV